MDQVARPQARDERACAAARSATSEMYSWARAAGTAPIKHDSESESSPVTEFSSLVAATAERAVMRYTKRFLLQRGMRG